MKTSVSLAQEMCAFRHMDGKRIVMDRPRQTRQLAPTTAAHERSWWLRRSWKWIERSLLIGGVGLVTFVGAAYLESFWHSRQALTAFNSTVSEKPFPAEDSASRGDDSAEQPKGAGLLPRADESQSAVSTSRAPLAVLEIPAIRLTVPVFDDTKPFTLNHGVGRIRGTARLGGNTGNIGIAGHRDRYFRGLKDLHKGDQILLRKRGGIDTYIVDRFQVVSPRDVQVLAPTTTPSLTLVTCYPFYFVGNAPKRFVVTAHRIFDSSVGTTAAPARPFNQPHNQIQEIP